MSKLLNQAEAEALHMAMCTPNCAGQRQAQFKAEENNGDPYYIRANWEDGSLLIRDDYMCGVEWYDNPADFAAEYGIAAKTSVV